MKAAQRVSLHDQTMPVIITLTNDSKEARTIKLVTAEIQATENKSGFEMSLNNTVQIGNTTDNNEMYSMQTLIIGRADSGDAIVLQPTQSKTITLNVVVNSKTPVQTSGDHNRYKYELQVKADIEGVTLDPQVHQVLEIV